MDRGPEIARLLHAALTRHPRDRAGFLAEACAGDAELRREVERRLEQHDLASGMANADDGATAVVHEPGRESLVGRQLAHYRILHELGAGGMGEVYRARDERLERDVAIKVLPAARLADPTARARLLREARAAAALNHPHICTIHEVGESGGRTYIAMELVEGRPLSARLAAGGLPLDETVRYGVQLADALAHAHDRGVLHRDLKSANIIVTPDGRVKVLDFGLARRLTTEDVTTATTQSQVFLTRPGALMGTVAYMAPEQLRGRVADQRSDVWALGVVLYEMAAGALPFQGQTGFELSATILSELPAPPAPSGPPALQAVIARCLEKDADRRYARAGDVRAALDAIPTGAGAASAPSHARPGPPISGPLPPVPAGITRRRAIWLGGAAAAGAVSGVAAWRLWPRSAAGSSLAVLPFANALGDADFEYLCDGITESLIRQVSRLPSLRVVPSSAVFNLKGTLVDPRVAGRQLGVDTILTGALRVQSGRLLVTAELVDVLSGRLLWSNRYDREVADVLDIQDDIASAIVVEGLNVPLSSDERRQIVRHPTEDPEAFDLYLQAQHFARLATEEDYLNARQLLRRAIIRDPRFALAYVALAGTHAMMAVDGLERPTDAWPQASRYTRQALEIDPNLPEAHALVHSLEFYFNWDWTAAERERRILTQLPAGELEPGYLRSFALERWALGRPDEALQLARRARERDPLSPLLTMIVGDYLIQAGQLEEAVNLYERSSRQDPSDPNPYFGLAEARYRQGRFDEAIQAKRLAHAAAGNHELDEVLAAARGEEGYQQIERAWVQLQLEALKARAVSDFVSPLDFARAHAQLGEREEAFHYLDAAFADRSPGLVFLKVDRAWDGIRDDERFMAAVRRVGLPD
jgi:serine/threonine protein kinase/TolB-like protein